MGAKNSNRNFNFFSLKAKTGDNDNTPYFGKSEKVGGKYEIADTFDTMEGKLAGIKHGTYEYEGQTKHKVEFKFVDDDGTINVVGANFNYLTYTILNQLCGAEKYGLVSIMVWLGKPNNEGKRFPAVWTQNDGETLKSTIKKESIPKATAVQAGNKTVWDDEKVIEFWIRVINDGIAPKLPDWESKPEQPKQEAPTEVPPTSQGEQVEDDLPF